MKHECTTFDSSGIWNAGIKERNIRDRNKEE